jgi:hypothetical protein
MNLIQAEKIAIHAARKRRLLAFKAARQTNPQEPNCVRSAGFSAGSSSVFPGE